MTGEPSAGRLTGERGYCTVCRKGIPAFAPGPGGRPGARCPRCRALERHRFLALLIDAHQSRVADARYVLEVAPTPSVTRLLTSATEGLYVGTDLDPAADGRRVDVRADLRTMPFADGTFDVAVCFHVFEHIPDDLAAMRDLARVLSPSGIAFVQVPWRSGSPTDEDPSVGPEERLRRFGQADHVRWYGSDFESRLEASGLRSHRVVPKDLVPDEIVGVIGVGVRSPIWVVTRTDSADGPAARMPALPSGSLAASVVAGWAWSERRRTARDGHHEAEAGDLMRRLAVAEEAARKWEAAYHSIRNRWPVRVAAVVRGTVRRRG